jgi:hypothetical protein
MKKSHTDLIHTIEMGLCLEGFSLDALEPLLRHKENSLEKPGEWFNMSNHYKEATDEVINAKLDVYCLVLKNKGAFTRTELEIATKMLFESHDNGALAKGIGLLLADQQLLAQYEPLLQNVVQGSSLPRLDLEGNNLAGFLPLSVLALIGAAEWFNLEGNTFSNVEEGTPLHTMVYDMKNWRDVKCLEWQGANGGAKFSSLS